jgi:hypothetical protein
MDDSRKQIIIKEIGYWKKTRLLPEHYCDFLLALYTEGNSLPETNTISKSRQNLLFWLAIIPLIMFLLYFTELSFTLQMVSAVILIFFGIWLTIYLSKKELLFEIPLIVSALFLLFISVEMTLEHFPDNMFSLYGVLVGNCLLWLFSGWKFRQIYFIISGILGCLLIVLSILI